MILMIDNFDSFTYNLVQYIRALGETVVVKRNNEISLADIEQLAPQSIIISPGPCTPNESGISLAVVEHYAGKLPILGVCLGHQVIAQVFGATVERARKVMHGKTSAIAHTNQGVFKGLNNPLTVARYHSLVVANKTLPACFEMTAWTTNEVDEVDEIMAISHKSDDLQGVQFHPEAILTEQGMALLANFAAKTA
ncbi:MAG: para-aminobenzoate synthetase component 2 [Alteromonadaceae bacterium]|jgi:para-aminobenzoate synthetase component 2